MEALIFSIILFGIVYYEKFKVHVLNGIFIQKRDGVQIKKSIQKTMTTFLKFSALNCNVHINLICPPKQAMFFKVVNKGILSTVFEGVLGWISAYSACHITSSTLRL